jgi:predicted phage-related endonuclease
MTVAGHRRGDPEFIAPGSEAHGRLITASKVASILGVSRWESAYSLWHRMRGNIQSEPAKDIYNVGLAFEMALAELWKIEHPGWRLSAGEVQFVSDRFGFPAMATVDRRAMRGKHRRIVEFKIARDLGEWGDPELSGDLPMDYVTQVIFQQMVSGITDTADVVLMSAWFKHFTYHVEHDQTVADWIAKECLQFWQSLQTGDAPDLDDSVSTYACVKALHPEIDGTEVEVPAELVIQLREIRKGIGEIQAKQLALRAQLLDLMGNAQYAHVNGETVARRQRGPKNGVALMVL